MQVEIVVLNKSAQMSTGVKNVLTDVISTKQLTTKIPPEYGRGYYKVIREGEL